MRKLLLFLGLALAPLAAHATSINDCSPLPVGYIRDGFTPTCGNLLLVNNDGSINVNATASIAGFAPNGNIANLSVTTSSANVALPAGTTVVVTNKGATDASIKLSVGASTAATTDFLLKSGAAVGLTVGSNTYINAITASSTTTLNIAGGTGLATGYGGGGSTGGATTLVNFASPSTTTMQSAATANGNGVVLDVTNASTAALDVICSVACSGGTLTNFEVSVDGTTWTSILGNPPGGGTAVTSVTTSGEYRFDVAGYSQLRARISAYSAGTITVKGYASSAPAHDCPYCGTAPFSGAIGSALPSTAAVIGVNLGGNTAGLAVGAAGSPPTTTVLTVQGATGMTPVQVINSTSSPVSACSSILPISQTTSTDLHTMTNTGYICSIVLVIADAESISLTEGTGSVCATGAAALIGSTTVGNGAALSTNGGFSAVSALPIIKMGTSADHLCLLQSGSGRLAGFITYNDHS